MLLNGNFGLQKDPSVSCQMFPTLARFAKIPKYQSKVNILMYFSYLFIYLLLFYLFFSILNKGSINC